MTPSEKKLYSFIFKAIKEAVKSEMKGIEDRIVERIQSTNTQPIRESVPETMTTARKAISHGMQMHRQVNRIPEQKQFSKSPILNDLINSTAPVSEQGQIFNEMAQFDQTAHVMPPVTGNEAVDKALAAPFKDYSAFMKKVAERDKTRKG